VEKIIQKKARSVGQGGVGEKEGGLSDHGRSSVAGAASSLLDPGPKIGVKGDGGAKRGTRLECGKSDPPAPLGEAGHWRPDREA